MSLPLVSCIMPTRDRRAFVPKSIEYFLRQDYPNKELVIGNDGEWISDLLETDEVGRSDAWVHYRKFKTGLTLGAKRNALVEACTGDSLIAHWHDDDWYGPQRLSRQVAAMQGGAPICGLDTIRFHDLPTDKSYVYHYFGRPYLFCSTVMYTRAFWEALHFPAQDVQSSSPFIWPASNPRRLDGAVLMQDTDWFVGMKHLDNHNPVHYPVPFYQLADSGETRRIVGVDWPFYEALRKNLPPRQPGRGVGKTPPTEVAA